VERSNSRAEATRVFGRVKRRGGPASAGVGRSAKRRAEDRVFKSHKTPRRGHPWPALHRRL